MFGEGGAYTQFGEMHDTHQATLGVMVHELGHDLGLPDMYDIDNTSAGVGVWSIMSYGSWQALPGHEAGDTPSEPDAFSRSYEGWLTPQQVTGNLPNTSIAQVETSATAYRFLDNPLGVDWSFYQSSGTGEYFLVENREPVGYDAALPGCGLLVWHIDETRTSGNSANADDSHRLVDLEEADGLSQIDDFSSYGDDGDPFPGASGNQAFNDDSNPNSHVYNGQATGVSLTNIGGCGSSVTADLASDTSVPAVAHATAPTSLHGAFQWTFTRPVTGITSADLTVLRDGMATPSTGSLTCFDPIDAVVSCDTGEVARAEFQSSVPLVAGEYYVMNANPTAPNIVAYDDQTPLATTHNNVRAQTQFSFEEKPISYAWATVDNKQALGGSFVRSSSLEHPRRSGQRGGPSGWSLVEVQMAGRPRCRSRHRNSRR